MNRSRALLVTVATAAVGVAAGQAAAADGVTAVPASARPPAREVTVRGTGQDRLRFTSVAKRRSATRWCLNLTVDRTDETGGTSRWSGEGYCGTIRRESAIKIAFACPYGVAASGFVEGRPSRIRFEGADGATARVLTRRVADRSGQGLLWATSVAAASLPGKIVIRERGRSRVVADLDVLTDICA